MAHLLKIQVNHLSTFSLTAQQNSYPLFRDLVLSYPKPEEGHFEESLPLIGIVVRLSSDPKIFEAEEWVIDELRPGQHVSLQQRPLNVPHELLACLTEELKVNLEFMVSTQGSPEELMAKEVLTTSLLPANFWGGESRQPDLLAAFVKPNGVYVESLVRQVAELLEANGLGRSIDGYQSETREKPYLMAAALWAVIFNQKLAYVSPPQGFARVGQRVRLGSEISSSKMGACLDTSLLFASCLEAMGLNPVIALGKAHAYVGFWLIDERFAVLTNDDAMDLRKRVDARDLVMFESTLVTNTAQVSFEQACTHARELLSEDREEDFVYLIDIKQARARKIRPFSTIEEKPVEQDAEQLGGLSLPAAPPLPPVRYEERQIDETPESRVTNWQRKLLDLTKRNPLLALKQSAVSIKLYCPNIAKLEDCLSKGDVFEFESAELSPLNDKERSADLFRLQEGSGLHQEYAQNQFDKKILIANMSAKKFEQNAINLYRKAKNELEDSGSNIMYLVLGMLRWKDNPADQQAYRAPLILLPVELVRSSAKAPIKIRQRQDEGPLFNATLIEFLSTEHSIDLNLYRDSLPEDESGIDVPAIWQTVRLAIAEQAGFEVVKELVLAPLSFTKYVMWRDLKDRVEDLKKNSFVRHLIDHPGETYQQSSHFLPANKVDEQIDYQKIFTPLNCDSSQLVAVEASGRAQDFVLEGPPGTGKSETIANIICHNLALGKKVLFVAEKMAALNVVYRRIERVGLDHLCLELHSNKSNKKAVLEQLRIASEVRSKKQNTEWGQSVEQLKQKRDRLNRYIQELHKPSIFGLSVRDAIARCALYSQSEKFKLGWKTNFSDAPINSDQELKEMLGAVKSIAICYQDVSDLDFQKFSTLQSSKWSNAWQSEVIDCLVAYQSALKELERISVLFSADFGLNLKQIDLNDIQKIGALSELVFSAKNHSISYALGKKAKTLLKSLEELSLKKQNFDQHFQQIGHNVSVDRLSETPIDYWISLYEGAKHNWFKRFFAKLKINIAAKKLGYVPFEDLSVLGNIQSASDLKKKIMPLAEPFEEDGVWSGWDTSHKTLIEARVRGSAAQAALSKAIGLSDDLSVMLNAVQSQLVEGRDFLTDSTLGSHQAEFSRQLSQFYFVRDQAKKLGLEFDQALTLEQIETHVRGLLKQSSKFKVWCEWVNAREVGNKYQLEALIDGLMIHKISASEAVGATKTAFCQWIAPQLIDASEELREFKSSSHEQLIAEFQELDLKVTNTTSEYVAAVAAKNAPDLSARDCPKEFGVLSRELQKKTRHIPVRQLFTRVGSGIMDLCPCMMMSPLSVAQYLPLDFKDFDLVVFDEASQMTTWDSVGAIARGKNVIVVGDPKQMPPTNFFSGGAESEDPDEEDLESILDQALAARLPHLRLKGHYRSRHETLIAFSNSKYYENSLITYPSAETKESAVTLRRVEGVYAKGRGRNNPIEAKAVVAEIIARLKNSDLQKQSIGVVTLNLAQQLTIEDLLDAARRESPEIEPYFQSTDTYDAVFVKNLESVQGDERDIIMLSLGYGPTEIGGRAMSMNFGPLNKSGGERRLNVAITRATTEVLVFASFDSSMIDLNRTSAMAVEHLKGYLDFAQRGVSALAEQVTADYGVDQFDSDFEQGVAHALRARGWKVQTQVGVSRYRVDLGVIHPDRPGKFLAGVECDGVTYHSSPSARDRDRIRQGVLEGLGWKLIRLWSSDYFQDAETSIDKIEEKLNQILRSEHLST